MPLQDAALAAIDPACDRCALSARHKAGRRCIPPEGEPGGVLVVDSFPTGAEHAARRPFAGTASATLRLMVKQWWSGPIAYDSALRCAPAIGAKMAELVKPIAECAGYLHTTLHTQRPERVIALGAHAMYALTGRRLQPFEVRRGYAWLHLWYGTVPVFFVPSVLAAAKNRIVRRWFEADLRHALQSTPGNPQSLLERVKLVDTAEDAAEAVAALRAGMASVDLEWAGRPYDADFRLLSLAATAPGGETFCWPRPALEDAAVRGPLVEWLRDPWAAKSGAYFKADTVAMHAAWGVWARGLVCDVRLLRRLLDTESAGDLATLAERVGRGGHKAELEQALTTAVSQLRRLATKNGGQAPRLGLPPNLTPAQAQALCDGAPAKRYGYGAVEPALLYRYNGADAAATAEVAEVALADLATRPALRKVWEDVVLPSGDTFARIEAWGIAADRAAIKAFGDFLTFKLAEVRAQLDAEAGPDFDPNSHPDTRALLFGKLRLPPQRETETGLASTDADSLEALAGKHPVVRSILRYRRLAKLKGTYADGTDGDGGLLAHVRADGRIHPTIHPDGADSGRTSSSAPNLQNIPSVENPDPEAAAFARMLRDCFVPSRGHVFVEFDYSQIELRIAADLSGDQRMLDIFRSGQDYHRRTAQMLSRVLWNIAPEDVTDAHRREVKPINFALLYDDDPFGIAFRVGISPKRAEALRDAVFGQFPELAAWIRSRVKETAQTGVAHTWWDGAPARERSLWAVADVDERAAKTARRGSWNSPIQGTANEYLVASATQAVAWILDNGIPAKLPITIHDSMLFDVREDALAEVLDEVPRIMAGHRTKNGVPLVADFKLGRSWGAMEKVKRADVAAWVERSRNS